jgi:hypothetical protein
MYRTYGTYLLTQIFTYHLPYSNTVLVIKKIWRKENRRIRKKIRFRSLGKQQLTYTVIQDRVQGIEKMANMLGPHSLQLVPPHVHFYKVKPTAGHQSSQLLEKSAVTFSI